MNEKLTTVNLHLARVVFVTAALFSVLVTLLATFTGETMLLMGTAFGIGAGGYALQLWRRPQTTAIQVRLDRVANAA
jgi:hypothetical protein